MSHSMENTDTENEVLNGQISLSAKGEEPPQKSGDDKNDPRKNATQESCAASKTSSKQSVPPKKKQRTKVVEVTKENSKTVSEIWGHFTRLEGTNPPRAACNYCGTTYAAHSRLNGTSSLWAHLESLCRKYPFRIDKKQKTLHDYKEVAENQKDKYTTKGKTLSFEEIRRKLAEMVITDDMSFKMVEGEGFIAYSEALEPRFKVPSRHTVARDCMKIFVEERKKLKKVLKSQRVCLTTDTWTSVQNLNYMCLTAHWIDNDWKLQKRIINFCIVENHKGETIAKQIEECLISWGIDKVLTITVDNATSNDRAIYHLKRKCKWKDVILNNDHMHVRCSAHIVNLIVNEGLEEQNDVILRVKNAVKYVRSSPARLKAFKRCIEKEKIDSKSLVCLDVETRWNSTYMMLEAAEKFEKAFERLGDSDQKFVDYFDCYELNLDEEHDGRKKVKTNKTIGPPMECDWISARNFVKFLKIFYNVTLRLSGSSYITSNAFFRELATVQIGLSTMINKGDYHMALMAMRMKDKFDKYWGSVDNINWLLFVAILLDPRYKLKYVTFVFATIYQSDASSAKRMAEKIEELLHLLYKHYADSNSQQNDKDQHVMQDRANMQVNVEDDLSELLESQFAKHLEEEHCVESKSEIAKYLIEVCEKSDKDFDVLNWWKVNIPKYPILSKVAREVLVIPVSTIASESAFSTSGRIVDPFRSSLSPKMVEALICSQDWLRAAPTPIDINTATEDFERFEELEEELDGTISSRSLDD